jgi:hypothetical protein
MNCRRIEKLIPLYVGGDLEVDKAGAVLSHTLGCARCNKLVAEYEESQRWLRSYTPPDFDDASLDDLKAGVLREINGRRTQVTFINSVAGRLRRRLVLATSAAFLIIFAALGFYVYQHKPNEASGPVDLEAGREAGQEKQSPEIEPQLKVTKQALRADFIRKRHRRPVTAARSEAVAASIKDREPLVESPDVKAPDQARAGEIKDTLSGEQGTSPQMLRIEIQTNDPSIRIIWFSPKENSAPQTKPATETD